VHSLFSGREDVVDVLHLDVLHLDDLWAVDLVESTVEPDRGAARSTDC
jgi:hypothetical protein